LAETEYGALDKIWLFPIFWIGYCVAKIGMCQMWEAEKRILKFL
jgi:hypothetical protein